MSERSQWIIAIAGFMLFLTIMFVAIVGLIENVRQAPTSIEYKVDEVPLDILMAYLQERQKEAILQGATELVHQAYEQGYKLDRVAAGKGIIKFIPIYDPNQAKEKP